MGGCSAAPGCSEGVVRHLHSRRPPVFIRRLCSSRATPPTHRRCRWPTDNLLAPLARWSCSRCTLMRAHPLRRRRAHLAAVAASTPRTGVMAAWGGRAADSAAGAAAGGPLLTATPFDCGAARRVLSAWRAEVDCDCDCSQRPPRRVRRCRLASSYRPLSASPNLRASRRTVPHFAIPWRRAEVARAAALITPDGTQLHCSTGLRSRRRAVIGAL